MKAFSGARTGVFDAASYSQIYDVAEFRILITKSLRYVNEGQSHPLVEFAMLGGKNHLPRITLGRRVIARKTALLPYLGVHYGKDANVLGCGSAIIMKRKVHGQVQHLGGVVFLITDGHGILNAYPGPLLLVEIFDGSL